jgi:hypothetical protein
MELRNKKTGEIRNGRVVVIFQNNDKFPNPLERHPVESLAKLNEEWEDYKSAEPLIKDEKVRKAVREWAECCRIPLLKHYFSNGFSCFICKDKEDNEYCLDFTFRIDNLAPEHIYTIAELCGEEEE